MAFKEEFKALCEKYNVLVDITGKVEFYTFKDGKISDVIVMREDEDAEFCPRAAKFINLET